MKDLKNNSDKIKEREDDISAAKADNNAKEKPVDDAFRTPNRKHKLEWRQPQDEQMYDDRSLSDSNGND